VGGRGRAVQEHAPRVRAPLDRQDREETQAVGPPRPVVAERGRWWARPDGRVTPADAYAERLAGELYATTR
jgi:hypothetical protein